MTSFLIVANDKKSRSQYISTFCKEKEINSFDITVIEKDAMKQSLGIDNVKQMQKKLFLKPLHSQTKAIILEDAQLLTIEAQNAMLKMLEEPPEHTIIILAVDSGENLLPTIQSRCQIIRLREQDKEISEKEKEEINIFVTNLNNLTISQALKMAEILAKNKEKTLAWIENVILIARAKMLYYETHSSPLKGEDIGDGEKLQNREGLYYFRLIKSFQSLHTLLKTTNVNPRFAIEQTLLSLIY